MKKTFDDCLHLFSDFDHMSVQIVKSDNPLTPAVLDNPAQLFNLGILCQLIQKPVKILFFKTDLRIICFFQNLLFRQTDEPVKILLQSQTAGERNIDTVILVQLQSKQILIKFSRGIDIRNR